MKKKKKKKILPKGTHIVVDMPEQDIREGGSGTQLRKGFPKRDETLNDGNLRRNYIGLPPDAGFTYGDAHCESCDFSYITHVVERPFCPKCGKVTKVVPSQISLNAISELIQNIKAETCNECNSNQFTFSCCSQCGSQMKGSDNMKVKKKKAESVDVDMRSLNDDIEFQVEDDEEGNEVDSFDEEINDGGKEDAPDQAPIDEQLNVDNDSDGQSLLDVESEDAVEDDEEDADEDEDEENVEAEDAVEDDEEDADEDDDSEAEDMTPENQDDYDGTGNQAEAEDDDDDDVELDIEDDEDDEDDDSEGEDVDVEDEDDEDDDSEGEDVDVEDEDAEGGDDDFVEIEAEDEDEDEDVELNVEDDDSEAEDMTPDVNYNVKKKPAKSEDAGDEEVEPKIEDSASDSEDTADEMPVGCNEDVDDDTEGCDKTVVEPVASIDELEDGGIEEEEVDAHLYGENTENPHWNITVKGMPVAAIYLSDQAKPFEVARFFTTAKYIYGLREAIAKNGLANILPSVHARVLANTVGSSELGKKMKKAAISSLKVKYKKQVLAMADKLLDAVRISVAGANKNIWEDRSNSLKDAMFEQMAKAGIHNPIPYIEKTFEQGADKFFENTLIHAQEIMAKPNSAVAELRKVVAGASYKNPAVYNDDEIEDEDSADDVSERLVEGNFNIDTSAFASSHNEEVSSPKLHLGSKLLADMDNM